MATVHNLESWSEFQEVVNALFESHQKAMRDSQPFTDPQSGLHFRGQADADWRLETTLERSVGKDLAVHKYFFHVMDIQSELESRTGQRWEIPSFREFIKELNYDGCDGFPLLDELYEMLVYLRHHGFPSPLLDWTESPYLAAYFAFGDTRESERVAIYAYQEGAPTAQIVSDPRVIAPGKHIRTHPRHFFQQSQYTVGLEGEKHRTRYCEHESVFERMKKNPQGDRLTKYTLPRKLRREVLRYLSLHNITAYSLFGSEESLMETLAIRTFVTEE